MLEFFVIWAALMIIVFIFVSLVFEGDEEARLRKKIRKLRKKLARAKKYEGIADTYMAQVVTFDVGVDTLMQPTDAVLDAAVDAYGDGGPSQKEALSRAITAAAGEVFRSSDTEPEPSVAPPDPKSVPTP